MSLNLEGQQVVAQVLDEKPLSIKDVEKRVREFLKRRYVAEHLSTENYSRLYGLQEALAEVEKTKRKSDSSEAKVETEEEPGRKRRQRRIT